MQTKYQDIKFGDNGKLAESYVSKLSQRILDGERIKFYSEKDGEIINYIVLRKVAILFYLEPERVFRSDIMTVRRRIRKIVQQDLPKGCTFGVDFYKEEL